MRKYLNRKILILPAVLVGVGILMLLVKGASKPERLPAEETARSVRVIAVPTVTRVPRFFGTGNVEPAEVWNGISEVSGKIVAIHPDLKKGSLIQAGEILLEIDKTDYQLAIAQAETNIEATKAQMAELTVQEENARASLGIEQEAYKSGKEELERQRKLLGSGTVARSEFESETRSVLGQSQSVQTLQNTINLYPAQRRRFEAELARLESQLDVERYNLQRTTLRMPFPGRIAESNVEKQQYVRQGDTLVVADGIASAEIVVQVPLERMANLIYSEERRNLDAVSSDKFGQSIGLQARVFLRHNGGEVGWEARVVRISDTFDLQTRTIGVVVRVDKPYQNVQPGIRPPLVKGLFVDVELKGSEVAGTLAIPRSALHGDRVYVVKENNRLERRPVTVGLTTGSYATITAGVEAGERIVVSDLVPAIENMLLNVVDDQLALDHLIEEVTAQPVGMEK